MSNQATRTRARITATEAVMTFQEVMLATLNAGGSVKIVRTEERGPRKGLARECRMAMDELVSLGLARKSRTGRYWGAQ